MLTFSERSGGQYSPDDSSWYQQQQQQAPVYRQLPSIEVSRKCNTTIDRRIQIVSFLIYFQEIRQIREFQDVMKLDKLENKHRTRLAKALIQYLQIGDPDRKYVNMIHHALKFTFHKNNLF